MSHPHTLQQTALVQVTAPIRRAVPHVAEVAAALPWWLWPTLAIAALITAAVILATRAPSRSAQDREGWGVPK
ncbi:hypothetical protein [Streptomonospora litoralis]|uniref:Uncharacterized protein n=1 Tax=Streptomonospora litoralis TaxID=2498135 RepID=A0A4P6Q7H3_9ACTN|nr:hypothetical protein [Streptomonospora litoralis]QBI56746.1 hypothetical protein EKD16_25025 [Streptomonospora litoralis]